MERAIPFSAFGSLMLVGLVAGILHATQLARFACSKRFHVDRGLAIGKSFGSYIDFDMPSGSIEFGLYKLRALAKTSGVAPEGSGSNRCSSMATASRSPTPTGSSGLPAWSERGPSPGRASRGA